MNILAIRNFKTRIKNYSSPLHKNIDTLKKHLIFESRNAAFNKMKNRKNPMKRNFYLSHGFRFVMKFHY